MEIRKEVLILLISSITLYIKEIDVFVKIPKEKKKGGGGGFRPPRPLSYSPVHVNTSATIQFVSWLNDVHHPVPSLGTHLSANYHSF